MKKPGHQTLLAAALFGALAFATSASRAAGSEREFTDPLPSWNEGKAKQSIIAFVERVTKPGSRDFVPLPERVAVFDNDGTLWSEQPMPVQLYFALDRVKALAPQHPDWQTKEPFASLLKGDVGAALAGGEHALMELFAATHTGMTTEEFAQIVRDWIATAKHPKTGKRFLDMTYQPMLEVLAYLRANGFKTFIVSGGGVEFMRVFAEDVYGVPPENVIGSSIKTHFEMRDGTPVLQRDAALDFFDDKAGKPVAINKFIGRRPIACFGNSDGDREMLMWTTLGRPDGRASLGVLVHHTDGEREFAYDRQRVLSGQLDQGLDEAEGYGWVLADMKQDWNRVFPG